MRRTDGELVVEVVYALADEQVLVCVTLPRGSTIREAIECSGIMRQFPDIDSSTCTVGVFGRVHARDRVLADGDRVEIYRPLSAEPKEARRRRVKRRPSGHDGP